MTRRRLKKSETCTACGVGRITPGSGLTVCPDCMRQAGYVQLTLDLTSKEIPA